MLVLTRKLMEKLYIGKDVCVTVVRLEGGQVRLGIEAPRDISVVRAELVEDRVVQAEADGTGVWPSIDLPTHGNHNHNPAPLRIRPIEARGTDIRRREPSR